MIRRIKRLICKIKGHKMTCDTYAGENTAFDDIECTRCGYHERITYY